MDSIVKNERNNGLLAVAGLLVSMAVFASVFFDTLSGLVTRWMKFDEAYSHGLLVLFISLYLFSRSWRALWPVTLNPNIVGFILLLFASAAWAVSRVLYIQLTEELALPVILWLFMLSLLGWQQSKVFIVSIGFLYFAIPFWDFFALPLQYLTVVVNELALGLAGITAVIDGVFVELPGVGVFEVAHGCSGLRYLVVGLTLATLFGYLNYSRWSSRLQLIALAAFLSLLANWIRVFVIIYAGYVTEMQSSLIKDHEYFGWGVFAVTLIPLFWFAHRTARKEAEPSIERPSQVSQSAAPVRGTVAIAVAGAVVMAPVMLIRAPVAGAGADYASIQLPPTVDGWNSLRVFVPADWSPEFHGYTQKAEGRYFDHNKRMIALNVYLYTHQSAGRELVQDANRLYDARRWRLVETDVDRGLTAPSFNHLTLENQVTGQRYAVVQAYYVAGELLNDKLQAKLIQAMGFFRGRHDASMLALSTPCEEDCASAKALLSQFIQQGRRDLMAAIDEAYYSSVTN